MKDKLKNMLRKTTPGGDGDGDRGSLRPMLFWIVVLVGILLMLQWQLSGRKAVLELSNYELEREIARTNVVELYFQEGGIGVEGLLRVDPKDPAIKSEWARQLDGGKAQKVRFTADIMEGEEYRWNLQQRLLNENITFGIKRSYGYWRSALWSLLPLVVVLLIIGFMVNRQMKRGMGMAMSFGRSRARKMAKDRNRVTFADLAGCDEAKEEVSEIVDYLSDPKKFSRLGGRIPRGVILIGPPGTGKTLLAKAIAGEADVPFFSISGSDFVEMFVGVGAARVRDLFDQGKRNAPCIIFVDEIDAVGRLRGAGLGGGHDEREQTLNALLVEMDGFTGNDGVIIIAATNRPDVLDPALLRPGRFDRQIVIDMPDSKGREDILNIHARKIKVAAEVDFKRIARGTPGFSGADLANLINEAALMSARMGLDAVNQQALEEARDKVRFGRERRSRVMDEQDKRFTAYHEAGHAIVLSLIPECEPLHKVTIVPRGIAFLGATMQLPEKDKYHYTRKELEGQIAGLLGGRVAEELIFDTMTSGARSDIQQATDFARKMVCEWGMSDTMGPLAYGKREEHVFLGREIDRQIDYSELTAQKIDAEIRHIIDEGFARAREIITTHRAELDKIAAALLKYEVIEGEEVERIIRGEEIREDGAKAPDAAAPGVQPSPAAAPEEQPTAATATGGQPSPAAAPEGQPTAAAATGGQPSPAAAPEGPPSPAAAQADEPAAPPNGAKPAPRRKRKPANGADESASPKEPEKKDEPDTLF